MEYVVIDEAPPADLAGDRMEGEILNFFPDWSDGGHNVPSVMHRYSLL